MFCPRESALRSAPGSFHETNIIINICLCKQICLFAFSFFYIGFSDVRENSTHSGSGQSHFCFFLDDSALVCSFPFVSSLKSAGALPEIQRCGPWCQRAAVLCRSSSVKLIMNHPWRRAPTSMSVQFSRWLSHFQPAYVCKDHFFAIFHSIYVRLPFYFCRHSQKKTLPTPPRILYLVICQLACASLQQKMTSIFKFTPLKGDMI